MIIFLISIQSAGTLVPLFLHHKFIFSQEQESVDIPDPRLSFHIESIELQLLLSNLINMKYHKISYKRRRSMSK